MQSLVSSKIINILHFELGYLHFEWRKGGSKSNLLPPTYFVFFKQPPKKTDQISHEKKKHPKVFWFIGMLWASGIQSYSTLFLLVPKPIGSMGLVYLPTWMVDFYGKCRQIYHTWILWELSWHMQFCSTPVLCLKRFGFPKPRDLLTVEFFPSLELTPDPRSYRENAEGFVASDAGRFPHPKSAQRISNAPSGSPRFLEGTENPLLQKYISYTKPMEKGTETLREFTGLLFLTFTETWGDFSIRRVTSCYIILLASRVFGILPRFNKQIHHHPKISKVNK